MTYDSRVETGGLVRSNMELSHPTSLSYIIPDSEALGTGERNGGGLASGIPVVFYSRILHCTCMGMCPHAHTLRYEYRLSHAEMGRSQIRLQICFPSNVEEPNWI